MKSAGTTAPSKIGTLSLLWLLTRREHRETRKEYVKALQTTLKDQLSEAEQSRAIEEELEQLMRSKLVEHAPRTSLRLTKAGERAALAALGVKSLPSDTRWQDVKKRYMVALSLDIPQATTEIPQEHIRDIKGVRAAILCKEHQLKLGPNPTLKQVRDALAWRMIGVESAAPFTIIAVQEVLLNRMVETKDPEKLLKVDKVLELLAAKAVGARRAHANGLHEALIRRWSNGLAPGSGAEPASTSGAPPNGDGNGATVLPVAALPDEDRAFAARVLSAARASETGRFGDNKVFISHVRRRLAAEGAEVSDVEAFKDRLVSAHRQGLLSLSRADLVEAMAPEDVDASETRYLSATFHFVRI